MKLDTCKTPHAYGTKFARFSVAFWSCPSLVTLIQCYITAYLRHKPKDAKSQIVNCFVEMYQVATSGRAREWGISHYCSTA